MKRFILIFAIVAMIVSLLVLPAAAVDWDHPYITVIDYLDYADRDHIEVDGEQKLVVLDLPCYNESLFVYGAGRYFTDGWDDIVDIPGDSESTLDYWNFPTVRYLYDTGRIYEGTLFDVSMLPPGAQIQFTWEITFNGYSGTVTALGDDFEYFSNFFGEPDENNYSYRLGRSALVGLPSHIPGGTFNKVVGTCLYEKGASYVGTSTDYIAPAIRIPNVHFTDIPNSITCRTSSVQVIFPIDDSLIEIAQNDKTQKMLDEINRQLNDQGKTMDQILDQQQQTNDKLDGITDYDPVPEAPDFQDSVDELDDVEQDALENVQSGIDDADETFLSALEIFGQYFGSFAALTILFNTFADMPFFAAILAVSLALGIVAAILGIGLDAARSGARSSARSSKKGRS